MGAAEFNFSRQLFCLSHQCLLLHQFYRNFNLWEFRK